MANKKAEILTMDGQVVSPITLATNVLLDDGRTAQDLLDSRDESMFSPTITTSSSISKVGQGDNVDFSENIIDGAYKSCVLKGKTLVNHNAEGNNRNEYACMPSLEGSNLTVNGTVESKVKSAILSGQTLVNLYENIQKTTSSVATYNDEWITLKANGGYARYFHSKSDMLKPSTKYLIIVDVKENTLQGSNSLQINDYGITDTVFNTSMSVSGSGIFKLVSTTKDDLTNKTIDLRCLLTSSNTSGLITFRVMVIEYQEGMENWDIPYFTGMKSVRMPVLKTIGKNLYEGKDYQQNVEANKSTGDLPLIMSHVKLKKNTDYCISYSYETNTTRNDTIYGLLTKAKVEKLDRHNALYSYHHEGYEGNGQKGNSTQLTRARFNTGDFEYLYLGVNSVSAGQNGYIKYYNIQLEESSTPTTYEPYKSNILTVNEPIELRGIGDAKDELNLLTGEVVERIGEIVLNGNESWKLRATTTDVLVFNVDDVGINSFTDFTNSHKKMLCDKFVCGYYENNNVEFTCCRANGKGLLIGILKSRLSTPDIEGLKAWLSSNNVTVQYQLANEQIKTVDLSDNVVYSYKDTTHYTCSSEEGSLLPTLAIEEGVKYKAIIKPSTKYSIVFNRTEVASGLTVDLGGATTSVTSSTLGKNIVQITTPPTLSHNYVIFKGLGNVIKDVQVIEGDVVGDEPYFEGMCDVDMPVLTTTGKNLFDGKIEKSSIDVTTGSITPNVASSWSATNYINVKNINSLYFQTSQLSNMNVVYMCFDENKNFIGYKGFYNSLTGVITPLNNTHYIRLRLPSDIDVSTTQIEQGTQPTSYEPYQSNILSTPQDVVLRGIGEVKNELDLVAGALIQRIGEIVLDGSEDWIVNGYTNNQSNVLSYFSFKSSNLNCISNQRNGGLSSKFHNIDCASSPNNEGWQVYNGQVRVNVLKSKLSEDSVIGFKQWLSQNPVTVQYELATPITKTIDLKQHPFAYKDGYVVLTSSSEEVSLTPTIEYSLIANRLGQIQSNQKMVEKQQAQIDELESMVITNLVNTQYQQALNEIKLGVK